VVKEKPKTHTHTQPLSASTSTCTHTVFLILDILLPIQKHNIFALYCLMCSLSTHTHRHILHYLTEARSNWQMGAPDDEHHQFCVFHGGSHRWHHLSWENTQTYISTLTVCVFVHAHMTVCVYVQCSKCLNELYVCSIALDIYVKKNVYPLFFSIRIRNIKKLHHTIVYQKRRHYTESMCETVHSFCFHGN